MVDECIEEDDKNKNHNWKVNLQFLFYLGKIEITAIFLEDIDILFFSIHLSFAMRIFVENDLSSTL